MDQGVRQGVLVSVEWKVPDSGDHIDDRWVQVVSVEALVRLPGSMSAEGEAN
ncbi:MAG: hypothetical protein GY847_35045 [Proteobacteria bacterium]|nr:hypothetical protein [Pseudomonadota bacterium]